MEWKRQRRSNRPLENQMVHSNGFILTFRNEVAEWLRDIRRGQKKDNCQTKTWEKKKGKEGNHWKPSICFYYNELYLSHTVLLNNCSRVLQSIISVNNILLWLKIHSSMWPICLRSCPGCWTWMRGGHTSKKLYNVWKPTGFPEQAATQSHNTNS